MSITASQDAHKLVLEVAEWLTASLVMILGQQGSLVPSKTNSKEGWRWD